MNIHRLLSCGFAALGLLVIVASCNQSAITGINASATPTTVASGGTSSLTATVTGTGSFDSSVSWTVLSGGGSLSSPTGASVTYTAPSVSAQQTVQVKASSANPSVSQTLTITVTPGSAGGKPVISSFTVTPSSLPAGGGSTTLAWNVTGATGLSIDGGVGDVAGQTSKAVNVTATKTFILTATNISGSSTATVDVTVGSGSLQPGVWDASNWNEATWQ